MKTHALQQMHDVQWTVRRFEPKGGRIGALRASNVDPFARPGARFEAPTATHLGETRGHRDG